MVDSQETEKLAAAAANTAAETLEASEGSAAEEPAQQQMTEEIRLREMEKWKQERKVCRGREQGRALRTHQCPLLCHPTQASMRRERRRARERDTEMEERQKQREQGGCVRPCVYAPDAAATDPQDQCGYGP